MSRYPSPPPDDYCYDKSAERRAKIRRTKQAKEEIKRLAEKAAHRVFSLVQKDKLTEKQKDKWEEVIKIVQEKKEEHDRRKAKEATKKEEDIQR